VSIWKSLAARGMAAPAAAALAAATMAALAVPALAMPALAVPALAGARALAGPVSPQAGQCVTPSPWDIVGIGAQSTLDVGDQLARNYDSTIKKDSPSTPCVYEWSAGPPWTLNGISQKLIVVKAGCKPGIPPQAISALYTSGDTTSNGKTYPCVDFVRSERARTPTDPPYGPGGSAFVAFAGDAVTYSSTRVSNVPDDLSQAQLAEIFGCKVAAAHGFKANTWGALLGAKARGAADAIDPIVPQPGLGTLSFWMEKALRLPTDTEPACGTAATLPTAQQPEENEGVSKLFLVKGKPNPNVIFPFSVGAYVAQEAHSAPCGKQPAKGQNMFGCDETGVLYLRGIAAIVNGKTIDVAPTVLSHGVPVTNPLWNGTAFHLLEFDVVMYSAAKGNVNHIPPRLVRIFGPHGYWCTNPAVLESYGFEPAPGCGTTS
jgi:hypothetical protein